MKLKEHIKFNYGSIKSFCDEKNLSQARVSYWCNTDWDRLTYTTKEKIYKFLKN